MDKRTVANRNRKTQKEFVMFGLGPTELILVAVIVVVLFGAKRLPGIGKGLGGALREFRSVKHELSASGEEGGEQQAKASGEEAEETKEETPGAKAASATVEDKVRDKVLEQVPGVKQAVAAKKKADKIREIIS